MNQYKNDLHFLELLARNYPSVESAASEVINLCAERSLPKGTEYFFSDLHGEYESFLRLIRSASGMIRSKIDLIFEKSIPASERNRLAMLIYYPESEIKKLHLSGEMNDEWCSIVIYRLILVCESVSAKYTRAEVREKMPQSFAYILDELLNVTDDINREYYYSEIISAILETGIAEDFIVAVCSLIRSLTINRLHIIGDIFDRGPRADKIMDELMTFSHIDIQWGNHDISWMGAAAGNTALIANVIRIALGYNSFDVLEDGYGLNLRPLSVFASEVYRDDPCIYFYPHTLDDVVYDSIEHSLTAKMHKAISVIQFKLEGQLIARHPEYGMESRSLFKKVDFERGIIEIDGVEYKLRDTSFPTVDPSDPLKLSREESELVRILGSSFHHSQRLRGHIKFLYDYGGMYKTINGNLLYHGCIPLTESGELRDIALPFDDTVEKLHGKKLLDRIEQAVRKAYFGQFGSPEQEQASDYMWYLWCGADSPLYGKDKMAFFERTFLDKNNEELRTEHYDPYYTHTHSAEVCEMILDEFGLDRRHGHIINGHVPVLRCDGESPIKGDGKLFVIDGGISKAYRVKTGIAGYTLIYDSHSLRLAEHKPYEGEDADITPKVSIVEKMEKRVNIADIDYGEELMVRINDLRELIGAYRDGSIRVKE